MAQIILKYGSGSPGTTLGFAEPAFDTTNNVIYIGMGEGSTGIAFYPGNTDPSFGIYATNASINNADFAKNASLSIYATETSIGLALFLQNSSLNQSKFTWVNGFLEPSAGSSNITSFSSLTDVCINSLIDKQVAIYDTSINKWKNIDTVDFIDTSIYDIVLSPYATNASVNLLNISQYASNSSVGIAIALLNIDQYATNASVNLLDITQYASNASINNNNFATNASVNLLNISQYATNASVGVAIALLNIEQYATNSSVNSALYTYNFLLNASLNELYFRNKAFATNSSVNDALLLYTTKSYVDGSLALLELYVDLLNTNTREYIDASLGYRDSSINDIWLKLDACLGGTGDVTKAYVDASLAVRDNSLNDIILRLDNDEIAIDNLETFDTTVATNASVGLALLPLTTNASVNLALTEKLNKTTDTFTGVLTINGSLNILGNIYQDGSTYIVHAENLNTNADLITLRENAVLQIPDGSLSGLKIMKADGSNNVIFGTNNDAILRVGWEGDNLVAIACRQNAPLEGGYAYWSDASAIFKTKTLDEYVKDTSLDTNDFYWNSGLLDVSTLNLEDYFYSMGYVDGSFNAIAALYATNASVNTAFRTNASIGYLQGRSVVYNSSIGKLDASIKAIYPLVFATNSSLGQYATNASINTAFLTNASLGLVVTLGYIDGSLNLKYDKLDVSTFTGTYTSDGSIVTVKNGLITSVI